MADAGFFRGTNSEQDLRFSNKQKKLLKTLKFEDSLNTKVDMKRIDLDVMRLWITKRVSEILGIEDDVVVEFVLNQLEEEDLDPRNMQINLTGFLNAKKAREFMGELWDLLIDAQSSDCGIPQTLINAKAEYLRSLSVERLATLDDPPSPELKNDSPPACVEAEERPIRDCDSPGKVSPSKTREPRHKEREQRFRRRQIHSARRSIVREQRTPAANESKADGRRRNEEPEKYRSSRRKMQENRRDGKDRNSRYVSSYKSNREKYDKPINEQRPVEKRLERSRRSRSRSKERNEKYVRGKRESAVCSERNNDSQNRHPRRGKHRSGRASEEKDSSTPDEERRSRRRLRDRCRDYYRHWSRRDRSIERMRDNRMRYRRDVDFAGRRREENRKRRSRSDSPHLRRDERDYKKHRHAKQECDDRRYRDKVHERNHKSHYKKKRSRSIGESDSSVDDNVNRNRMSRKSQRKHEWLKEREWSASPITDEASSKNDDDSPLDRRISSREISHDRVNTPDKQHAESESETTSRARKQTSRNITQTMEESDVSPEKILKNSIANDHETSAEEDNQNNKLYEFKRPDENKSNVNNDKVLSENFTSNERKALDKKMTPSLQRKLLLGHKYDETDVDKQLVKKKRSSSKSSLDNEYPVEKKKAKSRHSHGKGESRGKSRKKNKEKECKKRDKRFSSVEESSGKHSKKDKKKKKKKSHKKKRKHRHHSESSSSSSSLSSSCKKSSRRSRTARDSTSSDR
ncbi:Serine/arginine repetitive matrix protein 1 [Trichinella pseudospiralis]|uniref:Serine/arginine repetitive matrix protein 1 n=1 Tax=Trichinella pseudospiralis TaxID=6337 RepID=A0A0V1JKQ4_TRIPS|nr:Serine/arginine repetitive matrix protein 1 [Trichinella pseudospiralis]